LEFAGLVGSFGMEFLLGFHHRYLIDFLVFNLNKWVPVFCFMKGDPTVNEKKAMETPGSNKNFNSKWSLLVFPYIKTINDSIS
jgi:hypothetical protein